MLDKETSRGVRYRIRRILMEWWDPIGVNGIPEAKDEYDSYIGGAYELLQGGAAEIAISDYLRGIEVDQMEMVDASGVPLLPELRRYAASMALKELALFHTRVRLRLRVDAGPVFFITPAASIETSLDAARMSACAT